MSKFKVGDEVTAELIGTVAIVNTNKNKETIVVVKSFTRKGTILSARVRESMIYHLPKPKKGEK